MPKMPARRNYFIKKRFQLKYTAIIVSVLLIVMVATGMGVYFGMWGSIIENFSVFRMSQNLENAQRIAAYEDARYKKGDYRLDKIFREAELLSAQQKGSLRGALKAVNRSLLPKLIILAALIFIAGIFISHKIAGPMYRIERSAEAIRDGDLSVSFRVRKGDEMKETAIMLENMVDSLQADFARIKAADSALVKRINEAEGLISAEDCDKMRKLVKEIDGVLLKYKT
ncbi:MAG: methyl-accepting chemotaxis protein [Candidatus Omnitrophica bacterium]|nr:methyl-accepting chemotaxis protein [Candidatus Omnitrophota bacterium]